MPSSKTKSVCLACVRKYEQRDDLALLDYDARILRGRNSYDRLRKQIDPRLDRHYIAWYIFGHEPLCQVPWNETLQETEERDV